MYIRLIENNRHAAIVYRHDSSVQPCTLENIRILEINGYLSNVGATNEYTLKKFEGNKTIKFELGCYLAKISKRKLGSVSKLQDLSKAFKL